MTAQGESQLDPLASKRIGIVAHSAEGGALCFLTACREGPRRLGPHFHPEIVVSAIPMGLSLPGWELENYELVGRELRRGVEQVVAAGADFFICPDNTAHLVLERIADTLPIPGLHIADVVCHAMQQSGWRSAGLLGTNWTMTGSVYATALQQKGLRRVIPSDTVRARVHRAIFEELCQGTFRPETVAMFVEAIDGLKGAGADCVILGCTEIPLIIDAQNSPLPILDSTRLLARAAVEIAVSGRLLQERAGWLTIG